MNQSTVVLVTGVSSGIGRATAEKFSKRGYKVFGTVRNISKVAPISNVEFIEMDVSDDSSVINGINAVVSSAGRIDILVNSAGVTLFGATEETSVNEAKKLFDTNLFGILRTIRAVLPFMREQRYGRIVNVSSVLGFLPAPYMALYSASKHAVEGLSETLDHEIRQFGIRVSLVEPSFTKTNLDINAPETAFKIPEYNTELTLVSQALKNNFDRATEPEIVATTIVNAASGKWKMRHTPPGDASILAKLRRFMPLGPVSKGLRKTFGLH